MPRIVLSLILAGTILAGSPCNAVAAEKRSGSAKFEDIPSDVMTDGFLEAHPDLWHRRAGMRSDANGKLEEARKHYRLAARYGDKPSQARLGEMFWNGQGGKQDRVQGFLWMALAAERGYPEFDVWKMHYWGKLDPQERKEAQQREQAMLDEYSDKVAKVRQEKAMRRGQRSSTGSLLGYSAASALYINLAGGGSIDPERFYAREFWEPGEYWKLQDRIWREELKGSVSVGDLENLPAPEVEAKRPQPKE
ncbi:MAG: sel1 repeat family protein [Pseudoxanthomonas sp.]